MRLHYRAESVLASSPTFIVAKRRFGNLRAATALISSTGFNSTVLISSQSSSLSTVWAGFGLLEMQKEAK